METLYTAHATSTQGRNGKGKTDDGRISVEYSRPGSAGNGTNPEQLFALGYSACFGSAIEAIAKKEKIETGEISVTADVDLNQDDKDGYFIGVTLSVSIEKLDAATTQRLIEKAHHVCPYSKATRGNIEVNIKEKQLNSAAA
jgi:lipoyl-dependent peroxiredoxin